MTERDWKAAYEDEYKIVDRVWKALGISGYEQANGKTIDELVSDLRSALTVSQAEKEVMREVLEEISKDIDCEGPGCIYCERDEHPPSWAAKRAQQADVARVIEALKVRLGVQRDNDKDRKFSIWFSTSEEANECWEALAGLDGGRKG